MLVLESEELYDEEHLTLKLMLEECTIGVFPRHMSTFESVSLGDLILMIRLDFLST